ncbi:selenide, water dikinase SelD, partial [bacterium]|nr:selenide, water dikinase SelD [bacterium]
ARPGDVLVLTKPLGTGALVAAMKAEELDGVEFEALVACMTTLNRSGLRLWEAGATACTDVTGFGLTGHALEMALGSGVTLEIACADLPLLPRAVELCGMGFTCGGTSSNNRFTGDRIRYADGIGPDVIGLLNDPQTSGGLLISIPADRSGDLVTALKQDGALATAVIGRVRTRSPGDPFLIFH